MLPPVVMRKGGVDRKSHSTTLFWERNMRNIQYSNMSTWRGCGWTYYFSLLDRGGSNLFDAERRRDDAPGLRNRRYQTKKEK
jgi:hypothetical protein